MAISNRTKEKAKEIQNEWSGRVRFQEVVEWGGYPKLHNPDIIIQCTSLGLKEEDKVELDMKKYKPKFFINKRLFYDVKFIQERCGLDSINNIIDLGAESNMSSGLY